MSDKPVGALNRLLLLSLPLVVICTAQTPLSNPQVTSAEITRILTFEDEHTGSMPRGWRGGPPETIHIEKTIVHGGATSVRLERSSDSSQGVSTITNSMPVTFAGNQVELRGFLRTEDVSEFAGLWMRQDGDRPGLAFDNMQKRGPKGTTAWTEYSVVLPVHPEAQQLFFGVLQSGTGKTWVDDLKLLVDGKPVWEAPRRKEQETVISRDHEFDNGSNIQLTELTPVQVGNLVLLGKVWGFLKYHHPRVAAGDLHWDYELFRTLPSVLAAGDSEGGAEAVHKWVTSLGEVKACSPCAAWQDTDLHLRPASEWLSDEKLLGSALSGTLRSIHKNRWAKGRQFYVNLAPNVGNPQFTNEPAYANIKLPDSGYQLLALLRFWNVIEYWFPYRDLIGEDWDGVLREFIPKVALARDRDSYQLQLMALIARVHDTHANLWSSIAVRPPTGTCQLPVKFRFIESNAVVSGHFEGAAETPLKPGDVVRSLDGVPVAKLIKDWTPYYAASNEPTRLRDMARGLTHGPCGEFVLQVRRGDQDLEVKATRVPRAALKITLWQDLPGDTFRRLSDDVAYLKLSSVKAADAATYVKNAAGTKGFVIDIRNYPSDFMVFALGSMLVEKSTPFARFTSGDLQNPGAFRFTDPITLSPSQPFYPGKVVIIVDEVSQSSAEYTSMAFRASPRATVVGSTTAAADGNVSPIPLPGGLRSMISGIGVFYPDKRPTQRIGIIPDIEVRPTIEGIRQGRDEVLERAIRVIVGDSVVDEEIRKMTQP